jgi:nucleoside 2-deoxyribosyltransferase
MRATARAELEAAGRPIGSNDFLIAADAHATSATIVTANASEFKHIRVLNVELACLNFGKLSNELFHHRVLHRRLWSSGWPRDSVAIRRYGMWKLSRRSLFTAMAGIPGVAFLDRISSASAKTVIRHRMKGKTMKIYLAGPLGFSEAGRSFQDRTLIPAIVSVGAEVINPWKLTDQQKIDAVAALPYGPARRDAWRKLNVEIGGNNRSGIDNSDFIVAVLDGVDVDSGTASEIGYGFAKGKRIIGYRGDFRLSADNDGATVNLQVEYFIRESGGEIVTALADLAATLAKIKASGQDTAR